MMKICLTLTLVLFSMLTIAQNKPTPYFVLKPDGMKSKADTSKDFIIIERPGKSRKELYTAVLGGVNNVFRSPKTVVSKAKYTSISIMGNASKSFPSLSRNVNYLVYVLKINFKDGKYKIGPISMNNQFQKSEMLLPENAQMVERKIFSRDGQVRLKDTKGDLEDYFNNLVEAIINQSSDKWNDW